MSQCLSPFVALLVLSAQIAIAQVATVEVTIHAVKPEAKEITVAYKSGTADKSITLDVSRKAEITLNGKKADLGSLGPGLKASLDYDRGLEIVTKIVATGTPVAIAQPELVEVTELGDARFPWFSADGLTIYFERNAEIWTAHRNDPQSLFQDPKLVCGGMQPTLSADGLEMILIAPRHDDQGGLAFHTATRTSVSDQFRRPSELRELRDVTPENPCLSPDGLTLWFYLPLNGKWGGGKIMASTRPDRTSEWSMPKRLPVSLAEGQWLHFPYVSEDCLTLYCVDGGGRERKLMLWSRSAIDKPFANGRHIDVPGLPNLKGLSPRYIKATNEFVFSDKPGAKSPRIWIVKNFTLR